MLALAGNFHPMSKLTHFVLKQLDFKLLCETPAGYYNFHICDWELRHEYYLGLPQFQNLGGSQ